MKKIASIIFAIGASGAIVIGMSLLAPSAQAQSINNGNVGINFDGRGISISLNPGGPFTQDFQIHVCSGGACADSPWASTAGLGGAWSGWTWPGFQDGLGPFSITVNTRPLPPGGVLSNVQIGVQLAEANGGPGSIGAGYTCGRTLTPVGGGTSPTEYSYTLGHCDAAHISDTPDDFAVGIVAQLKTLNAQFISSNIPATFSPNQNQTNGIDSNPVEITVQNLGDPWISDQAATVSQAGQCDVNDGGYLCPSTGEPIGSKCTVVQNHWSSQTQLQHISGSFGIGANPANYNQQTTATCTLTASVSSCIGTVNPRCQNVAACGDGVCSRGGCDNAADCRTSIPLGGCGGIWTDCSAGTWGPGYTKTITGDPNVETNATTQFALTSLTAPGAAGLYTETWQMANAGANFGQAMPILINVASPVKGTITVNSHNSVTGAPVNTSWDIFGPNDPCAGGCSGASGNYSNQPAGTYNINSVPTPAGYALNGSNPTTGSIVNDGDTINFILAWDPVAAMTITPSASLSNLKTTNSSGTAVIANSGTAGSVLNGITVANVSYSRGNNWVNVSGLGGISLGAGNSANVTIAVDTSKVPGGCSSGCSATITFGGNSAPGAGAPISQVTINFTLTAVCGDGVVTPPEQCDLGAGNGICQGPGGPNCDLSCKNQSCPALPSCTLSANPNTIVPPQAAKISYNCVNVDYPSCTLSDQFGKTYNVFGNNGLHIASGTDSVNPLVNTTYTITCQGEVASDPFYVTNASVNVQTASPGLHETNP